MDWIESAMVFIKKYRYVVIILLAGLFLLALPEGEKQEEVTQQITESAEVLPKDLQESLAEILSQIEGAGKVQVLLTESEGARTVYQTDEDISTDGDSDSIRRTAVVVSDSDRTESGMIQQTIPPKYLGAIILCQGADSAYIRLSIVEAVSNATGLTSDKITVLKMK